MTQAIEKPNSTLQALSRMVIQFDDERLDAFYRKLSSASPEFREQYIDRVVGLLVKIERYFQHHQAMNDLYQQLTQERTRAEEEYHQWSERSEKGKSLEDLVRTDPEVHQLFNRLMSIDVTNKFLDQEGADFLLKAEAMLDEKIGKLHEKQLNLDRQYIDKVWHYGRRLSRIIQDMINHVPLLHKQYEEKDSYYFLHLSENLIFKFNDLFRTSSKPTPTGFHYIALDDFLQKATKEIVSTLNTDLSQIVRNYTYEILADLYYALVEFYSSFQGTLTEMNETVKAREANAQKLEKKMEQLKELVEAYSKQLDKFSKTPEEIESYAKRIKVLRTPKPPPSLRR